MTMFEYVKQNNGATLSPDFEPIEPNKGFAVSIAGYETTMRLDNPSALSMFENYLTTYSNLARSMNMKIGLWVDKGLCYFDLTKIYASEKEAIKQGKRNGQKAIYDFASNKSIYLY